LWFGNGGLGGAGGAGGVDGLAGSGGLIVGSGFTPVVNPNQQTIVIDFVRHGQTNSNAMNLIDTAVPGPPLNSTGVSQANAIAGVLFPQAPFAGIFDSQLLRTQQTAAPLATLLGMTPQVLPGLNEINAGIFEGLPQIPAGILYLVGPFTWTLGFPITPMLTLFSTNPTGVVFGNGFNSALQVMYDTAMANPVHSMAGTGPITDVAFSSALAIETGTLMTVDNPNPLLMFTHSLPNTGVVVIQGSPVRGWTMVSWDGVPVGPPSLPTQLLVDVRNVITPPQYAAWNIGASLFTGDPVTVENAVREGVYGVGSATFSFPSNVIGSLANSL
jgi:Histidine phosphatase superfamily (branch 1)